MLGALAISIPPAAAQNNAAQNNIVQNGSFESMQNDQPANWSFSSANPEIFKTSFPIGKARGHVAQMDVSGAVMSGYFSQSIALTPNTKYRLTALARLSSGKILIYLHAGSGVKTLDTRIYIDTLQGNPLVPLFWDEKWVQGSASTPNLKNGLVRAFLAEPNQWQPVALEFNSSDFSSALISLGAYFEPGQYAFDDVSIIALPDSEKPHSKK